MLFSIEFLKETITERSSNEGRFVIQIPGIILWCVNKEPVKYEGFV